MHHFIYYILMQENPNADKVKIKISEIISKCKRREDWINFSRELGKYFINIFRIILSWSIRIWWKIFYSVFDRFKKSKLYYLNFIAFTNRPRYWIFLQIFCFRSFIYKGRFSEQIKRNTRSTWISSRRLQMDFNLKRFFVFGKL